MQPCCKMQEAWKMMAYIFIVCVYFNRYLSEDHFYPRPDGVRTFRDTEVILAIPHFLRVGIYLW